MSASTGMPQMNGYRYSASYVPVTHMSPVG